MLSILNARMVFYVRRSGSNSQDEDVELDAEVHLDWTIDFGSANTAVATDMGDATGKADYEKRQSNELQIPPDELSSDEREAGECGAGIFF